MNRKLSGFQKKHFWFGEEPVESKSLTSYLRGEKDADTANHNAAWSSHTGKGLLYFSKLNNEKATPAGIINLVSHPATNILYGQSCTKFRTILSLLLSFKR